MAVLSGILSYSLKLGVHIFSSVVDFTEFLSKFFHLNGRTLFYNRATLIIKPRFVFIFFFQIVKLMPSPSADSKFVLNILKFFKNAQFFMYTQKIDFTT